MRAFLLAAGIGSRMGDLTRNTPKCLLPIGGRPLMDYWLDAFERAGVSDVLVNLHHHADQVMDYFPRRQTSVSGWIPVRRQLGRLQQARLAATRVEGIAAIDQSLPDGMVIDIRLPDGNGFDVCRKLKADPITSSIPVVMFSSISQSGSAVNDARQLGAAAFLFFPMVQEHLVSVVLGAQCGRGAVRLDPIGGRAVGPWIESEVVDHVLSAVEGAEAFIRALKAAAQDPRL